MNLSLNSFQKLLFAFMVFFASTALFAQLKPKPATAKKTEFKLTDLGLSFKMDTAGWKLEKSTASTLELLFTKDIPFRLTIAENHISDEQELRRTYKEGERYQMISGGSYITTEKDSATIKLNNIGYWFKKISYRPEPTYWSEMNRKTKLTSAQMVAFLNSDGESWKKSENLFQYYAIDRTTTGKKYRVQVLYFNNGEVPAGLEQKMRDIISGVSMFGAQAKPVSNVQGKPAIGWQEINYKQLGLRDIDTDLMFTNTSDGFYILGGDADYKDDRLIKLSDPSYPAKRIKKEKYVVIDSSYFFFFNRSNVLNWRSNIGEPLKLIGAGRDAALPNDIHPTAFVLDSLFFWVDVFNRLMKINFNERMAKAEILFSPKIWNKAAPQTMLLNGEIYLSYIDDDYMKNVNLGDPKLVVNSSVFVYNIKTGTSKEYKQVIDAGNDLVNYAGQPAFLLDGAIVKIFNPANSSFKQVLFPVKLMKGEIDEKFIQQNKETIIITNRDTYDNKTGTVKVTDKNIYVSIDACKTFKKLLFPFKEDIFQARVYKSKLYIISRPNDGDIKVRTLAF